MGLAVRPGRLAYEVLRLIVECPGEHTTGTLIAALDPAPRRTVPFTRDDPPARWAAMVAEHNRIAGAKMARMVGKLVEAGLVEKLRPPALSPEFQRAVAQHGAAEALARFHPAFPARPKDPLRGHLELVRRVRAGEGEEIPGSARDLLGVSPSGAQQRIYRELIEWGVLVAPQQRHPTAKGIALIQPVRLSEVA